MISRRGPDDAKKLSINGSNVPLHDSTLDSSQSSNTSSSSWSERLVFWNHVPSLKSGSVRGSSNTATSLTKKSPLLKARASRPLTPGDASAPYEQIESKVQRGYVLVKQAFGTIFVEAPLKIASPFVNIFSSLKKDGVPEETTKSLDLVTPTNDKISPVSKDDPIVTKRVHIKGVGAASDPDRDLTVTEIKDMLATVFFVIPWKIASPFVQLFSPPHDDEGTSPPRRELKRSHNRSEIGRSSQRLLHEVLAQSDNLSFWTAMYRITLLEFGGTALVQGDMHWMGSVFTLLWTLLPTTMVWRVWERIHGYFDRLWRAFAGNFTMPRRFHDPWKEWRQYIAQDLIGTDGGGRVQWNQWFAAAGISFAAFAYHTTESIKSNRRRRRLNRRRD